ncbi:hypothetical protein HFO07_27755 [Rhizobium leguminosarum]|uniref:hypothetical protein n=1 Tax=Rhizobium leguminosarum TaxID=384 RepID=UPI001C95FAEB|nr:hypothetical protein [Rhizobium leguminosarum]MBY5760406.1 hypothetical protein [Rhizobium leguminosarum]
MDFRPMQPPFRSSVKNVHTGERRHLYFSAEPAGCALLAPRIKKRSPAETGQSGKDGSYRKEGMADGPGIGATCTILMSKQRLVEKVPVRFRTNAWIDLYLRNDCRVQRRKTPLERGSGRGGVFWAGKLIALQKPFRTQIIGFQ